MGGIVLDVFLGNHAHLQERTEDKGVIIQYGLLHPDCQGGAFGRVEFLAQLFFQGIQLGAVVFPTAMPISFSVDWADSANSGSS